MITTESIDPLVLPNSGESPNQLSSDTTIQLGTRVRHKRWIWRGEGIVFAPATPLWEVKFDCGARFTVASEDLEVVS